MSISTRESLLIIDTNACLHFDGVYPRELVRKIGDASDAFECLFHSLQALLTSYLVV